MIKMMLAMNIFGDYLFIYLKKMQSIRAKCRKFLLLISKALRNYFINIPCFALFNLVVVPMKILDKPIQNYCSEFKKIHI